MLRSLLYKTLLTAIAILLGGWAVVAQHNVVKGTALSFKVADNPSVNYRWEVKNLSAGSTFYLSSKTNISEEYIFDIEGNYEVRVYPEDKINLCLGEPLVMTVDVEGNAPTVVFEDLATPYVCSANNGVNPRAIISATVNYTGPMPWTFKYSVDSEPAVIADGADEIWTNSFDFDVTIRNISGNKSRSEILIVEAQSISGIPVEENEDDHRVEIDVLGLPNTKILDYEPVAMYGTLQSYTANILKHEPDITPDSPDNDKRYEIFVPDGATVVNENTASLDDIQSELTFDIQWGTTLGDMKVKLIEKNGFNCYGDTIYANVKLVDSVDDFLIELGDDLDVCVNDQVILNPEPNKTQNYTFKWSTDAETPTISVTESGIYSVVVSDDFGNVKRDEISVLFHALPIVDLGEDLKIYSGESVTLDPGDAGDGAKYKWSTDEISQTIEVSEENVYSVEVINQFNCSNTDEISVSQNQGHKFTVDLGGEIEICEGDRAYLEPTLDRDIDATYKWIPGESDKKGIYVNQKGKYCVVVSDAYGNEESDCVNVTINSSPIVDLGDDVSLESGKVALLDAGNEDSFFAWSTGSIDQTIEVSTAGEYSVEVTNPKNCIGRDAVNVYFPNGEDFVGCPSGFTPNGDGNNDVLYVRGNNIKNMTFIIYNRGGQKIFQSNRVDIGWDGTYKGELQRMDTYVYILKVSFDNGTSVNKKGEVTMVN